MPTGGKSMLSDPSDDKRRHLLSHLPLVALMKDQVANLQKRNIKAIALTGGIKSDEMIDLLDNCQFETINFYLSPERLQSDWMENKKSAHKFNYH
jgi:ATP-dependent DNA helicase RecQ